LKHLQKEKITFITFSNIIKVVFMSKLDSEVTVSEFFNFWVSFLIIEYLFNLSFINYFGLIYYLKTIL
jgi:hypothetical protein